MSATNVHCEPSVGAGCISYTAWKALTGRVREVRPFLWIVSILFVLVFLTPAMGKWLGA